MVSIISSERWMLPLRVPLLLVSGEIIFGLGCYHSIKPKIPMSIHFCWDSVIDKKVYETWITLAGEVWKLMLTLYSPPGGGSEKYYLRYLLIGLAPEGK